MKKCHRECSGILSHRRSLNFSFSDKYKCYYLDSAERQEIDWVCLELLLAFPTVSTTSCRTQNTLDHWMLEMYLFCQNVNTHYFSSCECAVSPSNSVLDSPYHSHSSTFYCIRQTWKKFCSRELASCDLWVLEHRTISSLSILYRTV